MEAIHDRDGRCASELDDGAEGAGTSTAWVSGIPATPSFDTESLDRSDAVADLRAAERMVIALSKLSPIQYDRERRARADELGIRVETLDSQVVGLRAPARSADSGLIFEDPEPWANAIDRAGLLDQIRGELERYLVMPPHASTAIALWALHTWCLDAFPISPMLHIRSPQERCGKTNLMIVLREIVRRPVLATSASTATIFRSIEEFEPTLLLDEADAWMRANEELRGVLNGGHSRKTACVLRVVGDNHEVRAFSTFCPKVIAGIGRLADTLMDRSVVIAMKRKRVGDRVDPLREDRLNLSEVRRKCLRWARDHLESLRSADPATPAGLNDRAADNWRGLLAFADAAGGNWPLEVRAAARVLSHEAEDGPRQGSQ
jgi:putative DNA primase/helicase